MHVIKIIFKLTGNLEIADKFNNVQTNISKKKEYNENDQIYQKLIKTIESDLKKEIKLDNGQLINPIKF